MVVSALVSAHLFNVVYISAIEQCCYLVDDTSILVWSYPVSSRWTECKPPHASNLAFVRLSHSEFNWD